MNLQQLKQKAFENPEVKKEYDKLEYEFLLMNELLKMRKSSGLTQEQIAKKLEQLEEIFADSKSLELSQKLRP